MRLVIKLAYIKIAIINYQIIDTHYLKLFTLFFDNYTILRGTSLHVFSCLFSISLFISSLLSAPD